MVSIILRLDLYTFVAAISDWGSAKLYYVFVSFEMKCCTIRIRLYFLTYPQQPVTSLKQFIITATCDKACFKTVMSRLVVLTKGGGGLLIMGHPAYPYIHR